jgi:hypothetical protein
MTDIISHKMTSTGHGASTAVKKTIDETSDAWAILAKALME